MINLSFLNKGVKGNINLALLGLFRFSLSSKHSSLLQSDALQYHRALIRQPLFDHLLLTFNDLKVLLKDLDFLLIVPLLLEYVTQTLSLIREEEIFGVAYQTLTYLNPLIS